MGIEDHEEALADAQAKFDALTEEIDADQGLDALEKDAIISLAEKVQGQIGNAAEGLEKGLKVGKMAYDLFKDPTGFLGKVGGLLGL